MRHPLNRWFMLVPAGIALAVAARTVPAAVLAPGQAGGGEAFRLDLNHPLFAGETLATRTLTRDLIEPDEATGQPIGVTISLTQNVVREAATGRLAFHYFVSGDELNATVDFEDLTAGGFAGFATDVYSDQTSLTDARSSRSADGGTVTFVADESWGGAFVVRTDATQFADGGTTTLWAQLQTGDPVGPRSRFPEFQTFRPVPEPPFLAPATGAAAVLLRRTRRSTNGKAPPAAG